MGGEQSGLRQTARHRDRLERAGVQACGRAGVRAAIAAMPPSCVYVFKSRLFHLLSLDPVHLLATSCKRELRSLSRVSCRGRPLAPLPLGASAL